MEKDQLAALIKRDLYEASVPSYNAQTTLYTSLCEVMPTSQTGSSRGEKGTVMTEFGDVGELTDGEQAPEDAIDSAHTWYCKIREVGKSFSINYRDAESIAAAGKISSPLQTFASRIGARCGAFGDQFLAGMLQKGTLTAGSLDFFDNSFVNETDPNPKFIYDGLPFFDTAHTLAAASGTVSNHTASRALTAANLQTTLTAFRTDMGQDDRGNRIMLMPDTLVVPPALEYTARTILQSAQLPGSPNNDANVVQGSLNLVVNPYLTDDTDAWWVGHSSYGIRCYDSGTPQVIVADDPIKRRFVVTIHKFIGMTVTDWRGWYNCNKAAS